MFCRLNERRKYNAASAFIKMLIKYYRLVDVFVKSGRKADLRF